MNQTFQRLRPVWLSHIIIFSVLFFTIQISFAETWDRAAWDSFNAAIYKYGRGDTNAVSSLKQLIRRYPSFQPAYRKLVQIAKEDNSLNSLQTYFQYLLSIDSTNAGALYGSGFLFQTTEQFHRAISFYKKSIRYDHSQYQVFLSLSNCFAALKQFDAGKQFYQRLLSLHPSTPAIYIGLGLLNQNQNNWTAAVHNYNQAMQMNSKLPVIHRLKSIALYYSGRLTESLDACNTALKLAKRLHQLEEEAKAHQMVANCISMRSELAAVIEHYRQAAEIFRSIGDKPSQYTIQTHLGVSYIRLGNYPLAYRLLKDCYSYFQARQDTVQMGIVMGQIGWQFMNQARYDSALAYIEPAAAIAERIGNLRFAAYWNRFLGLILIDRGEFMRALSKNKRALHFTDRFHDDAEKARVLSSIGRIFFEIGAIDSALIYYSKTLTMLRRAGDKTFEAHALANMAHAAIYAGQYTKGLNYYEQAYQIADSIGDDKERATWLADIGAVFSHIGDFKAARRYYRQSLRIATQSHYRDIRSQLFHNMGRDYLQTNQQDSALIFIQKALAIAREIGSRTSELQILVHLSECHQQMQNWHDALSSLQLALKIGRSIRNRISEPEILHRLAHVYHQQNRNNAAIDHARQSLELAQTFNQALHICLANLELGHIYFDLDSLKVAELYYGAAIDAIEQIRDDISGQGLRVSFFETKMDAFNAIIRTLVALDRQFPNSGYAEKAFCYEEQANSRSLMEELMHRHRAFTSKIPLPILAQKLQLEHRLNQVQTALCAAASRPKSNISIVDSLSATLSEIQHRYTDIRSRIERLVDSDSDGVHIDHASILPRIRQHVLKAGQYLLEYSIGTESSYLFVISRSTIHIFDLAITEGELQKRINRLLQDFINPDNLFDIPFNARLSHELYRQLVHPAASVIKNAETLYIIPDGILFYLPFELLITEAPPPAQDEQQIYSHYTGYHFLVEKYPLVYCSAAGLLLPREFPHHQRTTSGTLLALGNPQYLSGQEGQMAFRQQTGWNFTPLQYSEKEISAIRRLFKNSHILTQHIAKEDSFKKLAPDYRLLHISAHGVLDENQPLYSGLVLSQDADAGEDGFLQSYEIYDLRLNADMVTLSACATGLGRLKRGEGVVGLTRAFQVAGARSVVVSLWNVSDASTATLMTEFYRYLQQGMPKSRALQAAKLKLMRETVEWGNVRLSYAHPFFWAPFVLIGQDDPVTIVTSHHLQRWFVIPAIVILLVILIIIYTRKKSFQLNSSSLIKLSKSRKF